MKRRDILFVAAVLAVVGVLYFLSATGKKPPDIPPDLRHAAAKTKEGCVGCHFPAGVSPLRKEHPPKDQCFECHKMKTGRHGAAL